MPPSRRRPNAPLLPLALLVALVALLSLCAGALAFAPAISISILPPRTAPFRAHQPGPGAAAAAAAAAATTVSPRCSRRYAAVAVGSWGSDDDDDDRDSAEGGDGPRHLQPVQHGDELIQPRRSGRIPFSQRRGSSSSGGSGGGGGGGGGGNNGGTGGSSDGSSSSSRRRRGEGGGDPERGEGRPVFRGVRTSFNEMDEAGRFVRRWVRTWSSLCVSRAQLNNRRTTLVLSNTLPPSTPRTHPPTQTNQQPQRLPRVGRAGGAALQAAGQPVPPLRLAQLPLVRGVPHGHVPQGWGGRTITVVWVGGAVSVSVLTACICLTLPSFLLLIPISLSPGLDNAISVSVAHPVWQRTKPNDEMDSHFGWVFRSSKVGGWGNARAAGGDADSCQCGIGWFFGPYASNGNNTHARTHTISHARTRPSPPPRALEACSPATAACQTTSTGN